MSTAFGNAFDKMFTFSGREQRPAFWLFFLDYALYWVLYILLTLFTSTVLLNIWVSDALFGVLLILTAFGAPMVMAMSSAIVRRLHDHNNSGWWFWLWIIPIIGWIALIIMLVLPTKDEDNRYNDGGTSQWINQWWTWAILAVIAIILIIVMPVIFMAYFKLLAITIL